MAEKRDSEKQESIIKVNAHAGVVLHMDNSPENQPPDTYRYQLNGMNDTPSGDKGYPANAISNRVYSSTPQGYLPLGHVYMTKGRIAAIYKQLEGDFIHIGIVDSAGNFNSYVHTDILDIDIHHQIEMTYRLRQGCEDTIYWVDGKSIRYFNFAEPQQFQDETGAWVFGQFNLVRPFMIPCIQDEELREGGNTASGSYNFGIQLLDADLNPTPILITSNTVNLYYDSPSSPYEQISGSINDSISEQLGVPNTSKAIHFTVDNLDPSYVYYRVAVIRAISGTGEPTDAYLSPEVDINNPRFIFDGNLSGYTELPVSEILPDRLDLGSAEHIDQLENRLLLLGTKGKQIPWCDLQQSASKIGSYYQIREVPANDATVPGNPKNAFTVWDKMSEMGGDVTAWAICYIFSDGFISPAFHIPGPALETVWNHVTGTCQTRAGNPNDPILAWNSDIEHLVPASEATAYNALLPEDKIKNWQVYDVSERLDGTDATDPLGGNTSGILGYHQAGVALYTPRENACGQEFWGNDICGNPLLNQPVRHHRMPGRTKEIHVRNGDTAVSAESQLVLNVSALVEAADYYFDQATYTTGVTIQVTWTKDGAPGSYSAAFLGADSTESIELALATLNGYVLDTGTNVVFDNVVIVADGIAGTNLSNIEELVTIAPADPIDELIFDVNTSEDSDSNIVRDDILRLLGITFHNVEYPHPDIVGHYFVRADRDAENRQVLDTAIVGHQRGHGDNRGFAYFANDDNGDADGKGISLLERDLYALSPRFLFANDVMVPEYMKLQSRFKNPSVSYQYKRYDGEGARFKETDIRLEVRQQMYSGADISQGEHNFAHDKSMIVPQASYDETYHSDDNKLLWNISLSNPFHYISVKADVGVVATDLIYMSFMRNTEVHPNLDSIKYFKAHNCVFSAIDESTTYEVFGGDVVVTSMDVSNFILRRRNDSFWSKFFSYLIAALGVVVTAVAAFFTFGSSLVLLPLILGASIGVGTALTAGAIAGLYSAYKDNDLEGFANDAKLESLGRNRGTWQGYGCEHIGNLYVESEINTSLRHRSNVECGTYWDYTYKLRHYFRNQLMYYDQDLKDNWGIKDVPCGEYYALNPDYLRRNQQKEFFPLRISYECCTECLESNPSRAHYSEQSFQEALVDNYRVFLPNNYRDIEAEQGVITGVSRQGNSLFIHTSEALWQLPQNFQQQVTDELVTFLGTGEFFAIPPRRITSGEVGSGGCTDKWSITHTDKGVIFMDRENHTFWIMTDKLNPISDDGVNTFFENNGAMFLSEQFFALTGEEFPNDPNPANPSGIGYLTTYDKRFGRFILTKKDYEILDTSFRIGYDPAHGGLWFDPVSKEFKVGKKTTVYPDTAPVYFRNRSWTLSFDADTNKPLSFHSYLPNYYMHTQHTFLSSLYSADNLWAHDDIESFGNYYGTQYPWIIELVSLSHPMPTRLTESVMYQTIAKKYMTAYEQWLDQRFTTFNKVVLYNTRQSTGEQTLVVKDTRPNIEDYLQQQVENIQGAVIADINERDWTINDLKDYVDDLTIPMFTSAWTTIYPSYPIDKIVNPPAINFSKEWSEREAFRDKFLIIRFKYDNLDDTNLILKFLLEMEKNSVR